MPGRPTNSRFAGWFDPRYRAIGMIGFILNRVTGLGLVLYLLMHLIALGQLTQGPAAYDGFIALVHNPFFKIGELLVIAACFIHGSNGVRIALNSIGVGVRAQKATFVGLMSLSAVVILIFAWRMFS